MSFTPKPRFARQIFACALGFVCVHAVVAGQPNAARKPPAPKTHTLFMGADISVERDGELHRVQDVVNQSFVIVVNGERVLVPMHLRPVNLNIAESLKVSAKSATIRNLRGERAYTPANDPRRKFAQAASMAAGAHAVADLALANMVAAQDALQNITNAQASNPVVDLADEVAAAQRNSALATQQFDTAALMTSSTLSDPGYLAGRMHSDLAEEAFDAFEVTFEISAEKPLENPYLIIVSRYREHANHSGKSRNWVYAEPLPVVDEKSRRVRILRGGFPPGFDIERYSVHVYDRGVEIATNVARKRVALTDDEAFQYSVIEYIGRHKGATLSARPLKAELPAALRARLSGEELNRTFYVKVAKDGMPTGVFLDEGGAKKIRDAELESFLLGLRFNPALAKGKPVEAVAPITLSHLSL